MSRDLYAPAQLVDDQPIVPAPVRPDHHNPLRVEDTNPFVTGAQFQVGGTGWQHDGSPIEFSVRVHCHVEFNAYPAPSFLRGTITAGGRDGPSQDWQAEETILLYQAADLAPVKGRRKAKALPEPLAQVKENSGIARADLTPGTYVVESTAKLPFAFHIKALPPVERR